MGTSLVVAKAFELAFFLNRSAISVKDLLKSG